MIQIIGTELYQWDTGRSLTVTDSGASHVHFANTGDSHAVIMELTDSTVKVPDYLLQTGKQLCVYAVNNGVTVEKKVFSVRKRERPEYYTYEDDQRNYIYALIQSAEEATAEAERVAEELRSAKENGEFNGSPGKTPVKGVDYFTDAEVNEVATQVAGKITPESIGAAPDGYGLGLNANYDDIWSMSNPAHKNGWFPQIVEGEYPWGNDCGEGMVVHVSNYCGQNTHYTYYASNGSIVHRHSNYGTLGDYQWFNPRMELGIEYLTTELWNDNPVYTKLVNFGKAYEEPSSVSIKGATRIVRWEIFDVTNNCPYRYKIYPTLSISMNASSGWYYFTMYWEGTVLSNQFYVQLWYTK